MTLSSTEYSTNPLLSQDEFRTALREEAQIAVRCVLESAMREELSILLQAEPYVRTATRRGRRNGFYRRDLVTAVGPLPSLRVPRDRAGRYQTAVFERFARYQSEIIDTLTGMFFGGVSQTHVGPVIKPLLGMTPSASAVSRLAHDLEGECAAWRERPLQAHYRVIYLDGVYFPILHGEQKDETPLLVALGVDEQGRKEVLNVSVAGAESVDAWQGVVDDLKRRGVQQVDLLVTDGDAGLIGVLERSFPATLRQRCITHKERNVLAKVPSRRKKEVAAALKGIFAQSSREEAQAQAEAFGVRFGQVYPEAVACLERDLADCLTFYEFPRELWKHIRTTNILEGLFHTVRQRTNKMGAFRNEASCVLIVYAVIQSVRFHRIPA
jgi:transposase-like protein